MDQPQRRNFKIPSDRSNNDYPLDVLVLKSKIYRPTIRKEFVKRQALLDLLEAHVTYPMTLISAATGCGKSITTSQWLEESGHKYGWLSLDEEHNDPHVLLTYLVTLLKEQWPQLTFGLESLLQGVNLPSNLIATTFINDIDQLEDFFVLVLDDYHVIREEKIHEIINVILRYPPEQFQLVVLTQRDPPFHLARLRAQFRVNEIRMRDLAFTIDEAIKLRSLVASETTDDQVHAIVNQAEGWITGITVGLMGLAQGVAIEKVIQALHSGSSVISELLDEVVISGLPIETQKFLELTALMDRFSEELVRTMVASIDDPDLSEQETGKLMKEAKEKNLFLIPLDAAGEWYRYHHLFRSQIRKQSVQHFNEEVVEVLYKAASEWFEDKQLLEESLNYALRSKDMTFAIVLFSRFRHGLLNSEQLQRLVRLTNQFPEDVRNNNPELLINLAMLQHYSANFIGMQQYLSKAEKLLNRPAGQNDDEKQLMGEFHAVCTYLSYMRGDFEKAIDHGEKSMEFLPADTPNFFREQAAGWHAFAQQARGNAKAGLNRLEEEYQVLADVEPYFRMRLLQGKLIFHLFEGNTATLWHDGSALVKICSPEKYPGSWVIGIYSMAYHSYLNNHLEKASGFHDELRKYRFACRPFWAMQHFFIECLSAMAQESWQKAEHCIADCEELAEELAMEPLKGMVKAFQVEYYLRRHDVDCAREVSVLANFEPQPPTFFYYIPQLTRVKLLFQTQQDEKGQVLLQDLLEMGRARHNKNLLIQALALQAVIHFRYKRNEQAKSILIEALKIVESTQFIRPFLDHGSDMQHLLRNMAEDQPKNIQVIELLQAFDADQHSATLSDPTPNRTKEKPAHTLSKREIEILYLVTQGFKNKEIAEKLFISLTTVKQHLYRAYQKLEVDNRTSAIKRVKDLELVAAD